METYPLFTKDGDIMIDLENPTEKMLAKQVVLLERDIKSQRRMYEKRINELETELSEMRRALFSFELIPLPPTQRKIIDDILKEKT